MGEYVIVSRTNEDGAASEVSDGLRRRAEAQGWRVSDLSARAWLAMAGPRPPRTVNAGAWILIGDVIPRERPRSTEIPTHLPLAFERKLMARFWGRYVGCRLDATGRVDGVMRDPSGAFDCIHWPDQGCVIVTSSLPEWLEAALPEGWSFAIDRIAAALRHPLSVWSDILLDGPTSVGPGCVQPLPAQEASVPVWEPRTFAAALRYGDLGPEAAAEILEQAVDEAVRGLSSLVTGLGAEISGGLDSSIVAAALKRAGADVRIWLNAWGPGQESDERRYAEALAQHLEILPQFVRRPVVSLTEADLMSLTRGFRPGLNALDLAQDCNLADIWASTGIPAVMTGKGGDSVFVEAANANVVADLWLTDGWRALGNSALPDLARWNETSVWSMLSSARREQRSRSGTHGRRAVITKASDPDPSSRPPHPWLEHGEALGPAKTHQIAGIANGVTFSGPCAQTQVVDLFHPLLSQPVIEAALSMSTLQLTRGQRDRALARLAFATRIPEVISTRRSKGEVTAYYGRRIAASLDVLRPWLLEGHLARHQLIDRPRLEAVLTQSHLVWHGGYAEIMLLAAMESWMRVWQPRLR